MMPKTFSRGSAFDNPGAPSLQYTHAMQLEDRERMRASEASRSEHEQRIVAKINAAGLGGPLHRGAIQC